MNENQIIATLLQIWYMHTGKCKQDHIYLSIRVIS